MKTILLLLIAVSTFAQSKKEFRATVLTDINTRRAAAGLPEVEYASGLQLALNNKAKRLHKNFAHDFNNHSGEVVLMNFNYDEKIMVDQFFASPKHKAILMGKNVKYICVGVYVAPPFYGVIRTYYSKKEILSAIF